MFIVIVLAIVVSLALALLWFNVESPEDAPAKTYAESSGADQIDWNELLENPPEAGSYQHELACFAASHWTTCAVGSQCSKLKRDDRGKPLDAELAYLGTLFNDCVNECMWQDARECLLDIEARSHQLLKGMEC